MAQPLGNVRSASSSEVQLITVHGEDVAQVRLPADAPGDEPFVIDWCGRLFVFCRAGLYMEVQRVVIVTPEFGKARSQPCRH